MRCLCVLRVVWLCADWCVVLNVASCINDVGPWLFVKRPCLVFVVSRALFDVCVVVWCVLFHVCCSLLHVV